MYTVLGADGHVGNAVAQALLARGESVTVVLHRDDEADRWQRAGARPRVADIQDVPALRAVFASGARLFLLNPPAPPSSDTDVEERRTVRALLAALDGTPLERIVAASTYGAQPGAHIGDLGVLHELEQGLAARRIPVSVLRSAYYMSNWAASLAQVRDEGVLRTFFPASMKLAMVAPDDIGQAAADLLCGAFQGSGPFFIEGPHRYAPADVARAFEHSLDIPVTVQTVPRAGWLETLAQRGFSAAAATSFANMTEIALERRYPEPELPRRGPTSLERYIHGLVATSPAPPAADGQPAH